MHGNLEVVLEILLLAAIVGIFAKRLRVHYNIALVLAGVAVGASRLVARVGFDPEIVLQLFLPILRFEAAIATDLRRLRENKLLQYNHGQTENNSYHLPRPHSDPPFKG